MTRAVCAAVAAATLAAAPLAAQDATPAAAAPATLERFRQLRWLVGQWRGSGGDYPSFFESYRLVDDSTIQMRGHPDSTFTAATDSSIIAYRNGRITTRGGRNVAVEIAPTRVKFMREGTTSSGYTWERNSADQWTATLHPQRADGRTIVYVLRRARGR